MKNYDHTSSENEAPKNSQKVILEFVVTVFVAVMLLFFFLKILFF